MMVLSEKYNAITKVSRIHPLVTMNVCAEFHDHPSDSC